MNGNNNSEGQIPTDTAPPQPEEVVETCLHVYELKFIDFSTQIVKTKFPPQYQGEVVVFKKLDNLDLLIFARSLKSIEILQIPQGTSNIVGLDGNPADQPKSIIQN